MPDNYKGIILLILAVIFFIISIFQFIRFLQGYGGRFHIPYPIPGNTLRGLENKIFSPEKAKLRDRLELLLVCICGFVLVLFLLFVAYDI